MLKIYVDGAARPNPGLGGIGIVMYRDKCVLESYQFFGENKTNNQMEFIACVNGLFIAHQVFGCKRAELFTDSALVYGSVIPVSDPQHMTIKAEKLVILLKPFKDALKLIKTDIYHVTKKINQHYLKYIDQAHKLAGTAILLKKSQVVKLEK